MDRAQLLICGVLVLAALCFVSMGVGGGAVWC